MRNWQVSRYHSQRLMKSEQKLWLNSKRNTRTRRKFWYRQLRKTKDLLLMLTRVKLRDSSLKSSNLQKKYSRWRACNWHFRGIKTSQWKTCWRRVKKRWIKQTREQNLSFAFRIKSDKCLQISCRKQPKKCKQNKIRLQVWKKTSLMWLSKVTKEFKRSKSSIRMKWNRRPSNLLRKMRKLWKSLRRKWRVT